MINPTRRLPLDGLHNARDLGGFPAMDGRRVTRFGVYVRSEAPCGLSDRDIENLRAYGIRAGIDLRGLGEASARPSDLKGRDWVVCGEHPLFDERVAAGAEKKHTDHDWGRAYIQMAEGCRDWARGVLQTAADAEGGLLFHCTTGKDRTGLMTCYLLSIAGVPRQDIAADYCVSEIFLRPVYERIMAGSIELFPKGGPPDRALFNRAFFQTPVDAMDTLIDHMEQNYGGVTEFLSAIGVAQGVLDKIRDKFLN